MISLTEAVSVATILSNATGIVDKIYSRFFEIKREGSPPPHGVDPERSPVVQNQPATDALVVSMRGEVYSKVTYEELSRRLDPKDLRYIKAREQTMDLLYQQ